MVLKSHILDPRILETQCQSIILNPIQLHLFSIQFLSFVTLAFIDFDPEESNSDDAKFQLDQETSNPHENPADTPTQTLWDQAESNDKFALQILKILCSGACHHNRIPLTECEECQNSLYFYERKYVSNSNCLCFQIIQLAHDSTADDHLKKIKCYELIS